MQEFLDFYKKLYAQDNAKVVYEKLRAKYPCNQEQWVDGFVAGWDLLF